MLFPSTLFAKWEIEWHPATWPRRLLIPAEALNGVGRPQVYDHVWYSAAGWSRRGLLQAARKWEAHASASGTPADSAAAMLRQAQGMRDAIAFFDSIGWLTPVKAKEEAE